MLAYSHVADCVAHCALFFLSFSSFSEGSADSMLKLPLSVFILPMNHLGRKIMSVFTCRHAENRFLEGWN